MPRQDRTFTSREFLFSCEEQALAILPPAAIPPHRKVMWTILQMYYDDPKIHFELQPQSARRIIELGLHFESTADVNDAWAAALARRATELIAQLGPEWELEAWTQSWRRLHRTIPFEALTASLAREVASSFARLVLVLGPIVQSRLLVPSPSSHLPAPHGGHVS